MVSVIVPIYNVEKYLNTCLDSILMQTYQNLEIILVDDGSTDGCGVICDKYQKKDSRIRVIHKQNGGLSDARNSGIENANGDYIVFIDSDDYIRFNMIERLLQLIEDFEADLAVCAFQNVTEDSTLSANQEKTYGQVVYFENEDIMMQLQNRNLLTVVSWNKIYRASLFEKVRYPKGHVHEDEFIIHRILHQCHKTVYTDEKLYYYRRRQNSIMGDISLSKLKDVFLSYEDRIMFLNQKHYGQILIDTKIQMCNLIIKYSKTLNGMLNEHEAQEITENLHKRFCSIIKDKEIECNVDREILKGYRIFARSPQRYYQWVHHQENRQKLKKDIISLLKRN